jgi:hypothetical protein
LNESLRRAGQIAKCQHGLVVGCGGHATEQDTKGDDSAAEEDVRCQFAQQDVSGQHEHDVSDGCIKLDIGSMVIGGRNRLQNWVTQL